VFFTQSFAIIDTMIDEKIIEHIARLARIEVKKEDAENLACDIGAILKYVEKIKDVSTTLNIKEKTKEIELLNIFREDGEPHKSGIYTKNLIDAAPNKEENYIKVKKIII